MTILLSIYHIIFIIIGAGTIFGFILRFFHSRLRDAWTKDLSDLERKIDDRFKTECSPELVRKIVREELGTELRVLNEPLGNMNKTLNRLEEKIDRQEENIIAIQTSVSSMSAHVGNLQRETDRLEIKKQDKPQQ